MKSNQHHRILVIEDHDCVADYLKIHLEAQGHEVCAVSTGEQGLEIADQFQPSLVLCDLTLPGIDGYTVARILRRYPSLNGTRFIAMTGYNVDRSELHQAGFEHGLSKPFTSQDLYLAVGPSPRGQGGV
jgi:two-component system OmpR family response regulator